MRVPGVGVAGIAFDGAGRVLLVRRAKPPAQGLWAFPGGRVELGERLEAALRRELREECGIEVAVRERVHITEAIGRDPAHSTREARRDPPSSEAPEGPILHHWVIVQYRVEPAPGSEAVAGDDAAELGWFHPEEVAALPTVPGLSAIVALALSPGHLPERPDGPAAASASRGS